MNTYLKKLLSACLVVCITVCFGLFSVACNSAVETEDLKDGKDKFPASVSVTVMLDETSPAEGVTVLLCSVKDNGDYGFPYDGKVTNANGVATIEIAEVNGNIYEVRLDNIPDGYSYVDAGGKGLPFDVTKNTSVTITLNKNAEQKGDYIKVGNNSFTLTNATETLDLTISIETAGWYNLASAPFNLTVSGQKLENATNAVLYLNNDDKLSLSFNFDEYPEFPYNISIKLMPLGDGSVEKPVKVDIESAMVLNLAAGQTVYIANCAYNITDSTYLDLSVSGTNFKATYNGVEYSDTFKVAASVESNGVVEYETINVGTANGQAGVVVLYFTEYSDDGSGGEVEGDGTEVSPFILKTALTFDCPANELIFVKFVVPEEGTYRITYSVDAYIFTDNGEFDTIEDGLAGYVDTESSLEKGYELILICTSCSGDARSITISITLASD